MRSSLCFEELYQVHKTDKLDNGERKGVTLLIPMLLFLGYAAKIAGGSTVACVLLDQPVGLDCLLGLISFTLMRLH